MIIKTVYGVAIESQPILITSENRKHWQLDIEHLLRAVDQKFGIEHNECIFPNRPPYAGSTRSLMDPTITDQEFALFKPSVGDIDVQVTLEHKDKLAELLAPSIKVGDFVVVGTKKHGDETSVLMQTTGGQYIQIDFEGVQCPGSTIDQFLHSSDWSDIKLGIKGMHHKILLNAVGLDRYKFSITHGLRSRIDQSEQPLLHPVDICYKLFGWLSTTEYINSFVGVTSLISEHIPAKYHQQIYNKFRDSVKEFPKINHEPALYWLADTLGIIHVN